MILNASPKREFNGEVLGRENNYCTLSCTLFNDKKQVQKWHSFKKAAIFTYKKAPGKLGPDTAR